MFGSSLTNSFLATSLESRLGDRSTVIRVGHKEQNFECDLMSRPTYNQPLLGDRRTAARARKVTARVENIENFI